jgi:hypothetical protein
MISTANASNWNYNAPDFSEANQFLVAAATPQAPQDLKAAEAPKTKPIYKVKPDKIVKCRPPEGYVAGTVLDRFGPECVLPVVRYKGWELSAEALYARTKGKVRFVRGTFFAGPEGLRDVDMNSDMGLPEHQWIGSFAAAYRFNPVWSLRYSIMPLVMDDTGTSGRTFTFGNTSHFSLANTKTKWERIYHRIGLSYDPIRTVSSRVSVFGDYVRINERLTVIQPGCCGDHMDNDLNMAMAGLEFEKCLKTSRLCNTLSLECKAGVAFGDDAIGADISTGLKYSIAMNSGRWGYVKGGYRLVTYKKKSSDFNQIDTSLEGGFVQMGLVF